MAASSVPHSGVIWSLQLRGGRGGGSHVAGTHTPSWHPGSAPSPRAEPSSAQLLPVAAPCPPRFPRPHPAGVQRPGPASAEAVGKRRNPARRGVVLTFPVGKLRHGDGLSVSNRGVWGFNPSPALPGHQQHLPSFVFNPEGVFFFHWERQKPSPTSSYSCSGPDSSRGIGQWKECQPRAGPTLLGFSFPKSPSLGRRIPCAHPPAPWLTLGSFLAILGPTMVLSSQGTSVCQQGQWFLHGQEP